MLLRTGPSIAENCGRFSARADVELFEDVLKVSSDGVRRDPELICDLAVGRAVRDRLEDFPLSRGQVAHGWKSGGAPPAPPEREVGTEQSE
jgi:hypothetical protein